MKQEKPSNDDNSKTGCILEARNLFYTYDDGTEALKGINLGIERGSITAVLGGNGAGKSTLFLNFNGIAKPSSGEVLMDGKSLDYSRKGLIELKSRVGIVFQDPDSQLFSASVYQDVSFGAMNLKLPEEEVRRRVDEALERTGMAQLRDKPTHCLSFGQKKRAALAGVLVMKPEVLILDEPTAGLDPMGVSEIMKLLEGMQKELGITIIVSTHDIDIVPLYCDYAYVLQHGEVQLHGRPGELFREAEKLRKLDLRLPRIAHLMEILEKHDSFDFDLQASTIAGARKAMNKWRENHAPTP
jgi:cobalt/nickel transport system ATP-binding protein